MLAKNVTIPDAATLGAFRFSDNISGLFGRRDGHFVRVAENGAASKTARADASTRAGQNFLADRAAAWGRCRRTRCTNGRRYLGSARFCAQHPARRDMSKLPRCQTKLNGFTSTYFRRVDFLSQILPFTRRGNRAGHRRGFHRNECPEPIKRHPPSLGSRNRSIAA
jgi:hypothetical protein